MTAVRFYTLNEAPTASFAPTTKLGAWDVNTSAILKRLARTKSGASTTTAIAVGVTTANWDVLLARFVGDATLINKAGTLSGTLSIGINIAESNANANMFTHLHAYVLQGDTNTLRGTLLTDNINATEWPTTAAGRTVLSLAITDVAVQIGDRVVIEIGYRASATVTTYTGTLRYGGAGVSDLVNAGTQTDRASWFEFSDANNLMQLPPTDPPVQDTTKAYAKDCRATITSSGTATVRYPASATGEAQICIQFGDDSLALATIPSGSGWVTVGSASSLAALGIGQVYRRPAPNNPSPVTENWIGAGGTSVFFVWTVANADASSDANMFDIAPVWEQDGTADTAADAPANVPTTTSALSLVGIYSFLNYGGANAYTPPSGMFEWYEVMETDGYAGAVCYSEQRTVSGTTGERDATQTVSSKTLGVQMCIKTTAAVAPATVLDIGAGGSQLHALLQTPITDGGGSTLVKTLADLVAGYSNDPKFKSTTDGLWVHFEAALTDPLYAGAGSGARCELRETDASGTAYGFDATTGKHRLSGRSRIATIAASSDVGGTNGQGMVIAQCHNGTTDRITLRTQLISNQVKLLTRVNGTEAIRHSESYAANTQFEWALEADGNTVKVYYGAVGAMTLVYQSVPGVLVSTGSASWYFKAGVYNQITTGAGFNAVEHSLLTISHSDADATNLLYPFLHAGG